MSDETPLRIEVELFLNDNDGYIAWNVAGCVSRLREAPHEHEITLMVYRIHRNILGRRGVSEDELAIGDKYVEEAKTQYLTPRN